MYSKIELLRNFYNSIDKTQIKIETRRHSFDYFKELNKMLTVDYIEWKNKVYKLKLTNIKPEVFDMILQQHIDSELNICAYFNEEKNSVFCFNLDCFADDDSGIKIVAQFLWQDLKKLCIQPLVLKSGHGYHFWCRLSEPASNTKLQLFMKAMTDVAVFQAAMNNADFTRTQCICYPRPLVHDISIRIFGSSHIGTGIFSCVAAKIGVEDELLDEEGSWRYFENYLKNNTIKKDLFGIALEQAAHLAKIISEN